MTALGDADYETLKARLRAAGYGHEWQWAQSVSPPASSEDFAAEGIWVICCSGFREQAARITYDKVRPCILAGGSACEVFPRSGKGRAIDLLWQNRREHFGSFADLQDRSAPASEVLTWIATLPYVGGPTLRFHFAKNLGVDCAKPDRWLCRLAGVDIAAPMDVRFAAAMDYCRPLAEASGDRIATVDLVLWRACNLGYLRPETGEAKTGEA